MRHLGTAGHLCVSFDCRYHLHTHVAGYCVSTVGDWRERREDSPGKIGYDRLYETMVFLLHADGSTDDDVQHSDAYNDAASADAGHAKAIKWARGEHAKGGE